MPAAAEICFLKVPSLSPLVTTAVLVTQGCPGLWLPAFGSSDLPLLYSFRVLINQEAACVEGAVAPPEEEGFRFSELVRVSGPACLHHIPGLSDISPCSLLLRPLVSLPSLAAPATPFPSAASLLSGLVEGSAC